MQIEMNDIIEQRTLKGDFGTYLSNPYSPAFRAELVGGNLAFFRKKAKLSQKEVCAIIGCKPQTYSGYEKGKHEPTMETLVRLSWLYGASLDYLLGKNTLGRNTLGESGDFDDIDGYIENVVDNESLDELKLQVAILKKDMDVLKRKYKL